MLEFVQRIPPRIRLAGIILVVVALLIALGIGVIRFGLHVLGNMFRGPTTSGWTAGWVRDLTGDGRPEILLNVPFEDGGSGRGRGRSRIFDGRTGALMLEISRSGSFAAVRPFGTDLDIAAICESSFALAAFSESTKAELARLDADSEVVLKLAGDMDGDGCEDWFVVRKFEGPRGPAGKSGGRGDAAGVVQVISGRTAAKIFEQTGKPGELFGSGVCTLDDVDGDARIDFAIATDGDEIDRHVAEVFSGATLKLIREIEFPPGEFRDTLASAGDVDGDGSGDLLLGSQDFDRTGIVQLRSGRDGSLLREIRWPKARFGLFIGGVGDVDADGHDDILCGGWSDTMVRSGRTGEVLFQWDKAEFGSGRGDLDGDGHADMLLIYNTTLGERDPIDAAWDKGSIVVASGRDGSVLRTITGEQIRALHGK